MNGRKETQNQMIVPIQFNFSPLTEEEKIEARLNVVRLINTTIMPLSLSAGPMIAGGTARYLFETQEAGFKKVINSDIDLYFASESQFSDFKERLEAYRHQSILTSMTSKEHLQISRWHTTDNAISVTCSYINHYNVFSGTFVLQLIKKGFYTTPEDIFQTFDFTVACVATDGKEFRFSSEYLEDWAERRLELRRPPDPKSISRLMKYMAYGFTPSPKMVKLLSDSSIKFEKGAADSG